MVDESTKLPFKETIYLVVSSIKLRFLRVFIVIVAIATSIAYMVALNMLAKVVASTISTSGIAIYTMSLSIVASLVALTGTMNSLLILINERYFEIGTMKSFGARDVHIFTILALESTILSLIGGLLGFTIGFSVGLSLGGSGDVLHLFTRSMALSLIIGFLATVYPSYRASRLTPVEALRSEV